MTDSIRLLDKYCAACKHPSDSAAARALKVQPSAVNNWRQGRAKPSAEAVEKMCNAIGEPLRAWLPLIEAERARTPADRRVWLRLAQAAAMIVLAVSFGRIDVHSNTTAGQSSAPQLYIMSNA
jgi:transcriptional regulator with XRE-family HTH domain